MENKTRLYIHPYVRRGLASYIDEVKDDKTNANVSVTLQLKAHKAYTQTPPEMPDNDAFNSVSYKLVDPEKEEDKEEENVKSPDTESEKDILDELEQFLAEWQKEFNPEYESEQNINVSRAFTLAGPGEVKGLNPAAIRRVFPAQGSAPLAYTLIPYVEFYDDDLPWRFTPLKPEDGKLRPWLALVACKSDEFSTKIYEGKTYLMLKGTKDAEGNTVCPLPDVEDLHLYAHAQMEVFTDKEDADGEPLLHTSVSRVLCVSKLEKNTEYTAFLIPTFKLGMLEYEGAGVKDCAWTKESYAGPYPVYFQWSFKTGEADFKTLADLMYPMPAQQYDGIKDKLSIDVSDTGVEYFHKEIENGYGQKVSPLEIIERGKQTDPLFGVLPVAVALTKMASGRDSHPVSDSTKALVLAQEAALKDLLKRNTVFTTNKAERTGDASAIDNEDPWVVPPVYGARHKQCDESILDNGRDVVSQINLNLENRIAAGMGVTVVQQNQEDFVHRAWEKVELINAQNRIIKELSAMQSTNSIGQRRIMPHRRAELDYALDAIRNDAALRVATRSRFVGTAAITGICNEPSAEATETVMAQPESPSRPSGVLLDELQKMTDDFFWKDTGSGNRKKFSQCLPENKVEFHSEYAKWDLFKNFIPLRPYLSILPNLRTVTQKDDDGNERKITSNEWLFVPKHELDMGWLEEAIEEYTESDMFWGYDKSFGRWLVPIDRILNPALQIHTNINGENMDILAAMVKNKGIKMPVSKLWNLADWLQSKSSASNCMYVRINDWGEDVGTSEIGIALTNEDFQKVREEIQKHKPDASLSQDIIYLKVFQKDSDEDTGKKEIILPIFNLECPNIKYNLTGRIILEKHQENGDTYYAIDSEASGSDSLIFRLGECNFVYRKEESSLIERTANYHSAKLFLEFLEGYDHLSPVQLICKDGLVGLIVIDKKKLHKVPFTVYAQDIDPEQIIESLRVQCQKYIAALDKIQKYLFRPTHLTISKDCIAPGNEFALMDFFHLEDGQLFEDILDKAIKNIVALKPKITELAQSGGDAGGKGDADGKGDAGEDKEDTFATDTNQEKLFTILSKYNGEQGRTAEELAERLWEIANSRYPIMAYPELYDPTFFYLRDLDSHYVLPAAGTLPQDSISVFLSNPAFEESFLSGMNTEMGKELLWREYPTDERGSYFRKFWDKETLPDCVDDYFDVKEMHNWNAPLGHNHRTSDSTLVVFVIHAKLMRAFPDTQIVIANRLANGLYDMEEGNCFFPEMTSWLDNETFIVGFPLSVIQFVKDRIRQGIEYCLVFRENAQGLQFIFKDLVRYEAPKEEEEEVKQEENEKDPDSMTEEEKKKKAEEEKKAAEEKARKEEEEKARKKASDFDSSLYAGHRVKTYTVWGCDITDLIQNI